MESETPGPKGARKVTPKTVARVRVLRSSGESIARIAEAVGISTFSEWRIVSSGVDRGVDGAAVVGVVRVTAEVVVDEWIDPGGDGRAPESVLGVRVVDAVIGGDGHPAAEADMDLPAVPLPIPRLVERQAARDGAKVEAAPMFTSGRVLPLTRLLLTLPSLAAMGVLSLAESVIGQLRNGFDGVRSTPLAPVFLAFVREARAGRERCPRCRRPEVPPPDRDRSVPLAAPRSSAPVAATPP